MMVTQAQEQGWGYRLGQGARRVLRGYGRSERQMAGLLVANGLRSEFAVPAIWAVRLAVAGVLLYSAFWITVIMAAIIGAAWYAQQHNSTDFCDLGVHTAWDEIRNTPGYDPVPYEDIEHVDYPHKLKH
ncbi:DUF3742 family protein [Xanthobacter autotrophicus]|uniref:DUF3742 family protein n=1 Tax=Xanthobacter autotrophicus TaxID=280 RepID=UPI00372B91FB